MSFLLRILLGGRRHFRYYLRLARIGDGRRYESPQEVVKECKPAIGNVSMGSPEGILVLFVDATASALEGPIFHPKSNSPPTLSSI